MSQMNRRPTDVQSPLDGLISLAKGMWVTLKHLIARPDDTVRFPFERKVPPSRMHGRHILNRYPNGMEKCIGCELCAGACPADAIMVWGAENPPDNPVSPGERYAAVYEINMLRCIFCGLCVEACPTDAITMTSFFEFTGTSRSALVYSKDELLQRPPHVEWSKLGYVGDPILLSPEEMEQPGVGSLHEAYPEASHAEVPEVAGGLGGAGGEAAGTPETEPPAATGRGVPVVWLPGGTWQEPTEGPGT